MRLLERSRPSPLRTCFEIGTGLLRVHAARPPKSVRNCGWTARTRDETLVGRTPDRLTPLPRTAWCKNSPALVTGGYALRNRASCPALIASHSSRILKNNIPVAHASLQARCGVECHEGSP